MAKEKIVSVIDIGGNSVVLLVALCHSNGLIEPINEVFAVTRLAEKALKTGHLDNEAINRTIETLKEMKKISEAEGSEELLTTAASVVKNSSNRSEFLVRCHNELNIFPQVLSGNEEAKFTYLGATSEVNEDGPILTIDIGGGNTQIAFGTKDIMVEAHSLDIGCVNITEMFNIGTGGWIHNWLAAKHHIRKNLFCIVDPVHTWLGSRKPMVIVSGGTATAYAALLLRQNLFDRKQINSTSSYCKEVSAISRQLSRMSLDKRKKIPGIEEDRIEVLPAGLLILTTILKFFNFDKFKISANGLRFGMLRHYVKKLF